MQYIRLLEANQTHVVFDAAQQVFLVDGRRCRGLTSIVRTLIDVPRHVDATVGCIGCAQLARLKSALKVPRKGPIIQSRKRQRAGTGDLVSVGYTVNVMKPVCKGGADARRHGTWVDRDIEHYIADPTSIRRADPCSVALLSALRDRGLIPVATQVPIYSARLKLATAIDLLCVDAATRRKLYLLEVKASRMGGGATPITADACYRHTYGEASVGLDKSTYTQHQLQLWAMASTLREEYGLKLAGVAVIRTTPAHVFYYPMPTTFDLLGDTLVAAFLDS